MSETINEVNEQEQQQAELEAKKTVDYETYRKAVATEKKAKAERNELVKTVEELKAKLGEVEQKEESVQSTEMIEKLRKELMNTQKSLTETKVNQAKSEFKSKFFEQARKAGCKAPEKLLRLTDPNEIKSVLDGVNLDSPAFDADEIEYLVGKAKTENPEFFQEEKKEFPKINGSSFTVEKMSLDDKIKFLVSK